MVEVSDIRWVLRMGIVALASIGTGSAANAAAILMPTGGDIDATIFVLLTDDLAPVYEASPAHTFYDVRGSADVEASDGSTGAALGAGQLIGAGPLDPRERIFVQADTLTLVGNAGTGSESLQLTFDFSGSSLTPADPAPFGASWVVPVLGTAIGPVTDPFLLGFVGNNVAELRLTGVELLEREAASDLPAFAAHDFELLSIQNGRSATVPEPSVFGVIAVGLAMLVARRRKPF